MVASTCKDIQCHIGADAARLGLHPYTSSLYLSIVSVPTNCFVSCVVHLQPSVMASPRTSREEGAPLLSPTDAEYNQELPTSKPRKKPWIILVVLVFLLIVVVDIGAYISEPPKTRVYEANLCLRHYQKVDPTQIRDDGTVPEALCKVDDVQQAMAMMYGTLVSMLESTDGL
jgi:hypothetical protein